jgi:hypothetical protein
MNTLGKLFGIGSLFGQNTAPTKAPAPSYTSLEALILSLAILACLMAVAWYAITKTRPKSVQNEPEASQLLTKFREMNSKGGLTDEEFRTIKTTLTSQLQDELSDNGKEI